MITASPGRRCAEATDGAASANTPTGSDAPSIRLAVCPRRSHVGSLPHLWKRAVPVAGSISHTSSVENASRPPSDSRLMAR